MASPAVVDVTLTSPTPSATSATFNLSSSIGAGNLLIASCYTATLTATASAGWSPIGTGTIISGAAHLYWFALNAAGGGGDALTLTLSGSGQAYGMCYQVTGWTRTITDLGFAFLTASLDPPSVTLGAATDALWLEGAMNNTTPTPSTNYSNQFTQNAMNMAQRGLTAQTENPGVWGGTAGSVAGAWTIGIPSLPAPAPVVVGHAIGRASNW